jgi:hypothetical protein
MDLLPISFSVDFFCQQLVAIDVVPLQELHELRQSQHHLRQTVPPASHFAD